MSSSSTELRSPDALRPILSAGDPLVPERQPWIKRFLPRGLLGRSLMIVLTPLVLLQIITTWIFYDRHYDTITRRLTNGVAGDISALVQMLDPEQGAGWGAPISFFVAKRDFWFDAKVVEGGSLPPSAERFWVSQLEDSLARALRQRVRRPFAIDTRSDPENARIQVDLGGRILDVTVTQERLFSSTVYIFIIWMISASIVLYAVALIFLRNQVRTIQRLAKAADRFGRGLDVEDFRLEGATEVRRAALAFLRMRERIKRQIQQRTEMLAGVSHDLRTPLTRMKLELALLDAQPEIESLKADVEEMERMIEGYLAFARGEGAERPIELDLTQLLEEVTAGARRAGATIALSTEERLRVTARADGLRRCLANLIENATRYGGRVWVSAWQRERGVEILVDDDGPGIPPEKREEAFKPFFRLEASRNRETGGTGLGLTIARDIARRHGGDLTLFEAPQGGLRARVWLPG